MLALPRRKADFLLYAVLLMPAIMSLRRTHMELGAFLRQFNAVLEKRLGCGVFGRPHTPESLDDEGGDGRCPPGTGLPGQRDTVFGDVCDLRLGWRAGQLALITALGDGEPP